MRSAEQVRRTPREWSDHQAEQRQRILVELLAELRRAREAGAEWYSWITEGRPRLTREEYDRRTATAGPPRRRGRR